MLIHEPKSENKPYTLNPKQVNLAGSMMLTKGLLRDMLKLQVGLALA